MGIWWQKRVGMVVVICIALLVGFAAGCASRERVLSAGSKAVQKLTSMPDTLRGTQTIPAVGSVEVAFSPEGGITAMLVKEINSAKKSIFVQAYSFTSAEIGKALQAAKKRGVDVKIIMDKSNETASDDDTAREKKQKAFLDSLADSGIVMHYDDDFKIAHSKIMIIDGQDIVTGSFNFTYSAEHNNSENCLVLHGNQALANRYLENWQWRWDATQDRVYTK